MTGDLGKSDASRVPGTESDTRAGGRDGRGGLPGSAGAGGPPRGDCGRGLPADRGGCNRHGRDHRTGRGKRVAGTGGTPASGGWPRPRGPGAVRWAMDKGGGMCDNLAKPPMPPRGGCARGSGGSSSRPSSFSLRGCGSLPENHRPCYFSAAGCSDFYTIKRAPTEHQFPAAEHRAAAPLRGTPL